MAENDQILDDFGGNEKPDELHIGLKILAFLIPLAGAIIYFVTDGEKFPNKRKQACTFALIGAAVGIVLNLITGLAGG